eukprot:gnl/MRDRNA2_/MRDRNA2_173454_c0_seq1.p1 gnl/MRDRNA2_/MRDRNA2_173454_c0~~gnl/MRDRNA2_/MRDRNA2_173454_c0_seq1.p1  ORF type:complete len:501 (+),score=107.87 gnl/MRDRNA2_/MRDRNA2_173454_c0_seq1:95-1597(+)
MVDLTRDPKVVPGGRLRTVAKVLANRDDRKQREQVLDMRSFVKELEEREAFQAAEAALQQEVAARSGARVDNEQRASEEEAEEELEEVPKCHLHRKTSKACRFCKAHSNFLDAKSAREEKRKNREMKRLVRSGPAASDGTLHYDDKPALPNIVYFPTSLKERILLSRVYDGVIRTSELSDLKEMLAESDTCDIDVKKNQMDLAPSTLIMCVYRMMTAKLTEGELQGLLSDNCKWVRCAAYLYVRMGMDQNRYWPLLSDALMDDEIFKPFSVHSTETMTIGEWVERLLVQDTYCSITLPRVGVTVKKMLLGRLALYAQFRKRYAANLGVIDRYEDAGLALEVCREDGEWVDARTVGGKTWGRRCVKILVQFADGSQQRMSLGMVITPDHSAEYGDLTSSHGKSNKELLEQCRNTIKEDAVTGKKDYCRGDVPRARKKRGVRHDDEESDEEAHALQAKRRKEGLERELQKQEIMSKYCVGATPSKSSGTVGDLEAPDRMRLG